MNHTDFFQEYQNKKRTSEDLFKSLETKFVMNEGEVDEAFLGIKNAEERKKEIEDYFNKITTIAPEWKKYKLFLGDKSYPQYVKIGEATPEQKKQAFDIIISQASQDKFKRGASGIGPSEKDKSVVAYNPKGKTQDKEEDQNQQQNQGSSNYRLTKTKKGYEFGGPDRVVRIIDNAQSEINHYDWMNSPLKFLFDKNLRFNGDSISFDFRNGTVVDFSGKQGFWQGPFVGGTFESKYLGNSFSGKFFWNNKDFQAKPTAFIDGKFQDTTNTGILGMNNVVSATEADNFHLIQVPVGYSIEILTNKQLRHTVTVGKRLDAKDSNFEYIVYVGYEVTVSPKSVIVPWEQIRQSFDEYYINSEIKSIPEILDLSNGEQIIELRVLKSGTPPVFTKKEKYNATAPYTEVSWDNLNGLKKVVEPKYDLLFKLNNDQDFEAFNKIKGYADSPRFEQDMDAISTYLNNGIINSSDLAKFPYLKNILTPEVLSEDFGRGARTKKVRTFSGAGINPVNTFTQKPIKTVSDIIAFLEKKYEADKKAGKNIKAKYEKDFAELQKQISKSKKYTQGFGGGKEGLAAQEKESDAALSRLQDFVKYFIEKISYGSGVRSDAKDSNEIKQYFIDAIKNKIQQHKPPIQPAQTTQPVAEPIVGFMGHSKNIGNTPIGVTESVIRSKVRNILKEML